MVEAVWWREQCFINELGNLARLAAIFPTTHGQVIAVVTLQTTIAMAIFISLIIDLEAVNGTAASVAFASINGLIFQVLCYLLTFTPVWTSLSILSCPVQSGPAIVVAPDVNDIIANLCCPCHKTSHNEKILPIARCPM
jgi:hypothetical protein